MPRYIKICRKINVSSTFVTCNEVGGNTSPDFSLIFENTLSKKERTYIAILNALFQGCLATGKAIS